MRWRVVLACLAVALGGCRGCPAPAGGSSARAGVHVSLPPGWTTATQSDHGLRAGPAGRTVLRVDVRTGSTDALPPPLALAEEFSKQGPDLRVTAASQVAEPDLSLVVLEVSKQGSRARALLGLKRVGKDTFLCASEPGSSEEEVQLAADVCRGLGSVGADN
jgi:hypothetical protein